MKVIMVLFDSLNRHYLPSYGNSWIKAPNFKRLAENSVQFDNCFAGSLPCMPARRELHTGRYNFLHRSWGPLEPFDDSMPEILKMNGVYSHLATDHHLYWADGGATYHSRFSSWEMIRGQEGDPWKGQIKFPEIPEDAKAPQRLFLPSREKLADIWRQEWVNRQEFKEEKDYPQSRTFQAGIDFIEKNHSEDNWFLQIESFDPHEPYVVPEEYDALYGDHIKKKNLDWPDYHPVIESSDDVENLKYKYAALLSKCDRSLGNILDLMDKHKMWDDTMLIVCTDHGFLLGEHGWWAKNMMPAYNELVNTPLFIWDPRVKIKGEKRNSLVQLIDMAPTILEFFGLDIPKDMQGHPLRDTIANDKKIREACIFGWHGNQINCTDGKYVYMRGEAKNTNSPLYEYTLMPTHIKSRFSIEEMKDFELAEPFTFTKGLKTMKVEVKNFNQHYRFGTMLYDTEKDPYQEKPIEDIKQEVRMANLMRKLMKESDAPLEQYERIGLSYDKEVTEQDILDYKANFEKEYSVGKDFEESITWEGNTKNEFIAFVNLVKINDKDKLVEEFKKEIEKENLGKVTEEFLENFVKERVDEERKPMIMYFLNLLSRRK
ncbi:sulfatase [Fusobacterium sp.]|uniref:sulfatase n=1 Tax=Fusobacterium sp. TaxID=68766 RepID=UPI00260883E6|nr:sulfatase [Fusobacterium sp.]